MNKKTTPSITPELNPPCTGKQPCPSEQTLNFIRSFASNYQVERQLPKGLQGILLG